MFKSGAHTYEYDGRHQLLSATHISFPSESFSYDGILKLEPA